MVWIRSLDELHLALRLLRRERLGRVNDLLIGCYDESGLDKLTTCSSAAMLRTACASERLAFLPMAMLFRLHWSLGSGSSEG